MIYITFQEPPDMIEFVDGYFNHNYDPEWFEDPLVKEMILDIDQSKVLSPYCIQSPVLGQIPPVKISGGVKAVILMLKQERPIWTPACGDNCTKWIIEVGKRKDILIFVGHFLHFPEDFDAVCVDDSSKIHTINEWSDCMFKHLVGEVEAYAIDAPEKPIC